MFNFPRRLTRIGGSANGLLFLHNFDDNIDAHYVCNPITRQFIECHFHFHEELCHQHGWRQSVAYGFGASKVTGDHKVVLINSKSDHCRVYTLGTGQWRRVEAAGAASFEFDGFGAFVNGNLYWTVSILNQRLIACFDLETECFSTFPGPPVWWYTSNVELFTLRDCLCFWDESDEDVNGIWLMKECGGDEKSWRKEYVMKQHPGFGIDGFEWFQTIKVFKNGDSLVLCDEKMFFCYSIKTGTYQEIPSFGAIRGYDSYVSSLLLAPSYRPLKCFGMEDVISF